MAKYIGDRPTWLLTNQRWDNIDPNAVVSLVHQTLVRMWGNLVGPTWGCLTRPTFDTTNYLTNGNHVEISACVFGYVWESAENGAQDLEGGPVIYDPDRDIQAESTVYIPPAYASEGVWLWFKRFDGPAETDMRAYRPGATEDVAATATQYKEYVQFEALPLSAMPSTTINEDQGWFRFARLPAAADDGWTAGVPDGIQPLSFWDGWYTKRGTGTAFTALNTFGKFMYNPPDSAATSNTRHGLAQVLQAILNQLAIILDTTNIRDNETEAHTGLTTETTDAQWHDRPARGLTQLSADLAAIEAGVDVLAHPGLITEVEARLAAERGVALEITTRRGHSYANGHVAALARRCGARLVIDNDAHAPGDLLGEEMRRKVAFGAGLTLEEYRQTEANAWEIVQRCRMIR